MVGAYGPKQLLGGVFRGTIGASAEIPGRGWGLPRDRSSKLPELCVVTGPVVGTVSDLAFREIDAHLHGSLLRWQTGPTPPTMGESS